MCATQQAHSISTDQHTHHHENDGHDHSHAKENGWKSQWPLLVSLTVLVIMQVIEYGLDFRFNKIYELFIYSIAYLLAGSQVLYMAYKKALRFDFFNEFFLMSVATIGAFAIGSYSEGVAVMVFYSIGEWFQDSAVNKAKMNIKALLDVRPDTVNVVDWDGNIKTVNPASLKVNDIIQVKPGEKVGLDGELLSEKAVFNTAALTGESVPDTKGRGQQVLAGMVNLNSVAQIKVSTLFKDSKLSKVLEMVQDAQARKSQTQLFISRFAKVYTPIVFALAVLLLVIPYFLYSDYQFREWLYRSLVFLVISCPCALVVSIPLGYFGGIGLASKNGILFKGGNYLDVMSNIDTVVMDKTGTLTKGVFKVKKVQAKTITSEELITIAAAIESQSLHPVATAIKEYAGNILLPKVKDLEEIAGHGLIAKLDDKEVLAGNAKLLKKYNVTLDDSISEITDTMVLIAIDRKYVGYITIADEIKSDSKEAIIAMHKLGLKTVILSGDKQLVVNNLASFLNIDKAYGDLLPEDKVKKVEELKTQKRKIAFVGDGINDAPVLALADAGIAMGGLGSDAAIETADIVIQNDSLMKIISAIKIGRLTKAIVWQNIALAMSVKAIVLLLGAGGIANLWEAVIADVGVALLAILNAVRIQSKDVS
jgi:Cd2+/Zn2+-exporting ATPase